MHYVGPSIVIMIGNMLKKSLQIMKCIICYANHVNNINPNTKYRKCLITYYKTYGIIGLKKHVNVNHAIIAKIIEEEVSSSIINFVERQVTN